MATYKFNNGVKTELVTTTSASSGSGNNGLDLTISTGQGDGVGNGGNINIAAGESTGTGVQGSITFDALDSTNPIPFNEAGDINLIPQFVATSVIGALNELKNPLVLPVEQNSYSQLTDLNYNGTSLQDLPGFIDVSTGNWLINYSFVLTTSSPGVSGFIVVRDSSNNIIENSKTFITSNSSTNRYPISKHFIYTEANVSNNLKLSFALDGAGTDVAIEMQPLAGFDNPDQIPVLWGTELSSTFDSFNYTNTDINYNGTTPQDVGSGTISLTPGDWFIGYNLTLTTPTTIDTVAVFVRDTSNNIIGVSQTIITKNTTLNRINVSKTFILSVGSNTDYKLSFVLDSTADTNVAIEMDILTNFTGNDQVPNLWAVDISSFSDFQQTVYSTTTDVNYNGTNIVDITSTIPLSSGYWIVGYSMALNAPISNDSPITFVRDSSDNIIELSKYFVSPINNSTRYTVSKSFFFSQRMTLEDIKLSFRLNLNADTTTAIQMTGFSTSNPIQQPVIWAIRVGDLTGTSFLDLFDTPESYVGKTNQIVAVNTTETGLNFRSLIAGTAISIITTPDDFTINSDAFNSLNNVGAGTGIIGIDNGNELQMKTIIANSPLSLTNNANDITLDSDAYNSVNNIGSGVGTLGIDNGNELQIKTLSAGTNISLTNNTDNVEVAVSQNYVYETIHLFTTSDLNTAYDWPLITGGVTRDISGGDNDVITNNASFGWCTVYAAEVYKIAVITNGTEFSDTSTNTLNVKLYNNSNQTTPAYQTGALGESDFTRTIPSGVGDSGQESSYWISPDITTFSLFANDLLYGSVDVSGTLGGGSGPEGLSVQIYTRRLVSIP